MTGTTAVRKPLRADAQRNVDAIVKAASAQIEQFGASASLEDIARSAGVGSATLHRHFGTRRDLLQAVFADRIAIVCARGPELAASLEPGEALRTWLLELTEFSTATRGVADTLILDSEPNPATSACETMLVAVVTTLRDGAVEAGEMSPSASGLDLLALVNSISLGSRTAADPTAFGKHLLEVALDGAIPTKLS